MSLEEQQASIAEYESICEESYQRAKDSKKLDWSHWLDSPWKGFFEDDEGKCIDFSCFYFKNLASIDKYLCSKLDADYTSDGRTEWVNFCVLDLLICRFVVLSESYFFRYHQKRIPTHRYL